MINTLLFYYGLYYGVPIYNKVKEIYSYCYDIYDNIVFGLNSDEMVFYKDDDHTFFECYFNERYGITLWKYNKYKRIFYNYNCSTKDTKRMPLLSASIGLMFDDKFSKVYDLDEFIDTLHIQASNLSYPSLTQFVYAYMYTNKVYIGKSENFYINYLDVNANEYTKKLFVQDFDFCINRE